jgi:hypothetical protein
MNRMKLAAGRTGTMLWPLAQAAVIALMGPVILALSGTVELTWARALASFRFTGPLAAVILAGQLLLRWSATTEEVEP